MRVYFDNSALQRPLDTKNQARVILEAEAVLVLVAALEEKKYELVDSEVVQFEVRNCADVQRRTAALEILSRASVHVRVSERIEVRAATFVQAGIKAIDALHLASAEEIAADFFCTCDDDFLKKRHYVSDLQTRIVTPIELVGELGL